MYIPEKWFQLWQVHFVSLALNCESKKRLFLSQKYGKLNKFGGELSPFITVKVLVTWSFSI